MAKILVFLNGAQVSEKELQTGSEYTLGRASHSDIVLEHPEVSRLHAKLINDGQNWAIEVSSRYRSLIFNGQSLEKLPLSHNTIFLIPPFELHFKDELDKTYALENKSRDAAPVSFESVLDKSDKTEIKPLEQKYILIKLDAQNEPLEEITLGDGVIKAGRSRSCQIQLKDEKASRKHFQLQYDGQVFVIKDLGSPNKTYVNSQSITEQTLSPGDVIQVGDEKFKFDVMNAAFDNLPVVNTTVDSIHNEATEMAVVKILPTHSPNALMNRPSDNYRALSSEPVPLERPFHKKITATQKIIGAITLMTLIYILSGSETKTENSNARSPASQSQPENKANASFTKEQLKYIEDTYNVAVNLFTSGKYDLAAIEASKILQIQPHNEKAKEIQTQAQVALERQRSIEESDRRRREQEELKTRVDAILNTCQILYNNKKYSEVEGCVGQVTELDPENARAQEMVANANHAIERIQLSQEERAARVRRKASALRAFEQGKGALREKRYPAAINSFQQVVSSSFDDPDGVKEKSKLGIKEAKDKMMQLSRSLFLEGKAAYDAKDFKLSFVKLQKSLEFYSNNGDAIILLERVQKEANVELKNLYAESVIEENLGNIESAKKKWKIIIDTGLNSNEYYKKAKLKLGKYEK